MARQSSSKRSPGSSRGPQGGAPADVDVGAEAARRLAAAMAERDALAVELASARSRIAELEARQTQVADRIAWALDMLGDIADDRD